MGSLPFAAQRSVPAESFRHEAFLYSGEEDFVAGTSAFVRGALEAREAVLVAVVEPRASLLRQELGRDAEHVEFLDMAGVGRNPARIIPAWQDWVDRQAPGGAGFRGIAEALWAGRSPRETVECQQHEWLLNTAFDEGPGWWLLCPYDTSTLSGPVIGRAHDTHPSVVVGDTRHPSATYGCAVPAMFGIPLEEPLSPVCELGFDLSGLGSLRDHVADFARPVVSARVAADAVLVVAELAANSIKYGGGAGVLRLWHEDAALVCEVRDSGVITDPLAGRRRPTLATRGKAGLWITNQLCDLLQIRSAPGSGTVVRARLGGSGEAAGAGAGAGARAAGTAGANAAVGAGAGARAAGSSAAGASAAGPAGANAAAAGAGAGASAAAGAGAGASQGSVHPPSIVSTASSASP